MCSVPARRALYASSPCVAACSCARRVAGGSDPSPYDAAAPFDDKVGVHRACPCSPAARATPAAAAASSAPPPPLPLPLLLLLLLLLAIPMAAAIWEKAAGLGTPGWLLVLALLAIMLGPAVAAGLTELAACACCVLLMACTQLTPCCACAAGGDCVDVVVSPRDRWCRRRQQHSTAAELPRSLPVGSALSARGPSARQYLQLVVVVKGD